MEGWRECSTPTGVVRGGRGHLYRLVEDGVVEGGGGGGGLGVDAADDLGDGVAGGDEVAGVFALGGESD